MDLKEERNTDLIEAYDRTLKRIGCDARYMSRRFLVDLTINSPAKRFYVTVDEAAKHINSIERTGISLARGAMVQKQYEDIYRAYLRKRNELPGLAKREIISRVIASPAERFYLETDSACILFWRLTKNRKKDGNN